jgi:antitoxin component HigA of HigAB toxin-antitoxin module
MFDPITNDEEYQATLNELEDLIDLEPKLFTAESNKLEKLVKLIQDYERKYRNMNTTIWKFPITEIKEEQVIKMPEGAEILTIQNQYGMACLWAKVNPSNPLVDRKIYVYGTGQNVPEQVKNYIATVQYLNGSLIYHYFE